MLRVIFAIRLIQTKKRVALSVFLCLLLCSTIVFADETSKEASTKAVTKKHKQVDYKALDELFKEQRRKDKEGRQKYADEASRDAGQDPQDGGLDRDTSANITDEIHIRGAREKRQAFNYNTLNKDTKSLDKQMVTDIRDLTKYDPGISINETSQGTSSGFSMRGVDRNRVSISVDGLNQAQAFSPAGAFNSAGSFGGAINEMEVENVKGVQIQKGASSVVAGSGSLGGSVLYVTKTAFDVIKPGKKWGMNLKAGYTSKDLRYFTSIATGALIENMDILFINTFRKGREFQPYSWQAKPQTIDFYYDASNDINSSNQGLNQGYFPTDRNDRTANFHSLTLKPHNVWGATRELPNPMFYNSNSNLVKLGFELTPEHYLTGTFEYSKQDFDLVDMTYDLFPYWNKLTDPEGISLNKIINDRENSRGFGTMRWLSVKFRQNIHIKKRYGIEYKFSPLSIDNITPDNMTLAFNFQDISMDNIDDHRHCSKKITKDCWPTLQGQFAWHDVTGTREKKAKLELKLDKNFEYKTWVQEIKLALGIEYASYYHKSTGYREKIHWIPSTNNPSIYNLKDPGLNRHNLSLDPIYSHHLFASINDTLKVGQYFDFLLGLRIDFYDYTSLTKYSRDARYQNLSWHLGVLFKPLDYLELGYIASSGFNMPSIQQIYDVSVTFPGDLAQNAVDKGYVAPRLNPEQAINHELGITLDYRIGTFKASVFIADYKGLIAPYLEKDSKGGLKGAQTFKNVQDAFTAGFDLSIGLDWYQISTYLPNGLKTNFSFSIVRPRKFPKVIDKNSKNFIETSYVMDTIQPAKLVFAIAYDSPDQVWGISSTLVHSASKNSDELKRLKISPLVGTITNTPFAEASKSWTTLDISAWVNILGTANLRLGIFNVFNSKYVTWESLRQTGIAGISTTLRPKMSMQGYNRLNAAGINFSLVLEIKL